MHELRRQAYLSALGIETYFPRWHLLGAAESPVFSFDIESTELTLDSNSNHIEFDSAIETNQTKFIAEHELPSEIESPVSVNHIIGNILGEKSLKQSAQFAAPENAAQPQNLVQPVSNNSNSIVKSFSLSVWRLPKGVMIIDSRETGLALPTELLLQNILKSVFGPQFKLPSSEVIRWPVVEKSLPRLTGLSARDEMQTWLSVQRDLSSISCLWLMGEVAATYLSPHSSSYNSLMNCIQVEENSGLKIMVSRSLNELIGHATDKKSLLPFVRAMSLL